MMYFDRCTKINKKLKLNVLTIFQNFFLNTLKSPYLVIVIFSKSKNYFKVTFLKGSYIIYADGLQSNKKLCLVG